MVKEKSDALYEEVAKVAKKEEKAPDWAKDKDKLRDRCQRYEKSLRYWHETSKYCLIQNTVRHKLAENRIKLKTIEENADSTTEKCTEDLLNAYADNNESYHYLLGKKHCEAPEGSVTTSPSN